MIHSSVQQQQQQQRVDEKTVDDILGLQRFYHSTTNDTNKKRISIQMQDIVEEQVHMVPVKQTSTEMSAIHMLLDRDIKKALWVNDPLRLNIEQEEQEEEEQVLLFPFDGIDELPFKFKLKSRQVQDNLLELLYVTILDNSSDVDQEYLDVTMELPFATAAILPPTPPPKPIACTPAMPPPTILPLHMYEIIQEQQEVYNNDWLYTRDEDQSTLMTYSPRLSTTVNSTSICYEESDFTEETWDAIFHPLSTFKPNKGELEYYAWNPMNLPVAAARVAQRVLPSRTYTFHEDMATIPQLAPTPPLKPSPVLTLDDGSDHRITMEESTTPREGYYFDMLHEIRGNQRSFSVSSLGSNTLGESTPTSLFHSFFNKKKPIEVEQYEEYDTEEKISMEQQDPLSKEDTRYWTGNKLFIAGFICPFVWIYATFYLRNTNDIHWQKRCRLASIYFSLVISVVVMVIGVQSIGAAGARQTTSDTIRAVIAN